MNDQVGGGGFRYRPKGAEKLYYTSHFYWSKGIIPIAVFFKRINTMLFHNTIDYRSEIGRGLRMPHGGQGVVIGKVKIGKNATIMQGVTIGHRKPGPEVLIGDNVVVGANAVILGPLKIGNDVKVGAGATVVSDIPSGATVVGAKAYILAK